MVVGAWGANQGQVYIYARDSPSGSWMEVTKILAPDGETDFGDFVSLSGNRLLVGADTNAYAYVLEKCSDSPLQAGLTCTKPVVEDSGGELKHNNAGLNLVNYFYIINITSIDDQTCVILTHKEGLVSSHNSQEALRNQHVEPT